MNDAMVVDHGPAGMFTLLDRETVCRQLPDLPVAGMAKPLQIHLDFDASSVDEILGA